MVKVAMIALGGAVGTAMRYGVSVAMLRLLGAAFPFGTLLANLLGSFLLGVVMTLGGERTLGGVDVKLVIGTGVMGGFTTYSSFNLETIRLAEQGAYGRAGLYVGLTVVTCLLAGLGGVAVAKSLSAP